MTKTVRQRMGWGAVIALWALLAGGWVRVDDRLRSVEVETALQAQRHRAIMEKLDQISDRLDDLAPRTTP